MSDSVQEGEPGLSTPVGTRRSFFTRMTALIASFIGASLTIPIVGYVIFPAFARHKKEWVTVGTVKELPLEEPKSLDYTVTIKDGWDETKVTKGIWAIKHSNDDVTVFSPICPHLGCGYRWDAQDHLFKCPCHGSVYNMKGVVQAGPAPRPLDTLPVKIENGQLMVIYEEFKSGLSKKVEL
ncbi:MAG: ubiquinol-cytochrome c reductase iron-sulfur subunit [Nitrospirales bacterium]|nr:ubiquinol-cytochrome c reductase iron-sulfur subunit [Nitrospira sp.]MDR4501307.1 ubiquinol-cytochrome c reductase iron-sulfur subunit [Nitrospirales bacterium]